MKEKKKTSSLLRHRFVEELRRFWIYAGVLTLFFSAFTLYRRLILGSYDIDYLHYEYGFVESLVLAKIIIVGQMLKLGERFENRPLAFTTLCKTIIFSLFVFLFSVAEYVVVDFFRGKDIAKSFQALLENGLDEIAAKILVMFFFFLFFFAFLELSRVLGKTKLFDLFFRARKPG